MKKWTTCIALLLLVGCGAEEVETTSLTVQSVDASDECTNGGMLISIDADEYLVCNGEDGAPGEDGTAGEDADVSTRMVGPGEADNPCEAGALEVTITSPGDDPVVEYVCEAYDDIDHTLGEVYNDYFATLSDVETSFCLCDWENEGYESVDECVTDNEIPYSLQRYANWCVDMAVHVYEKVPAGGIDFLTCQIEAVQAQLDCYDAVDGGNACTPEDLDAVDACLSELENPNCFDIIEDLDEEEQAEFDEFDSYFQFICGNFNL